MENKDKFFGVNNKVYIVVIGFLIGVLFYYKHFTIASIALIVYCGLIVYYIRKSSERKIQWKNFIESFSSKMDVATSSTLLNLPFPLLIIDNKGNVLWYNQEFILITEGEELIGKSIKDISKEINLKRITLGKENVFNNIKIQDKYFDVWSKMVSTDDQNKVTNQDSIILLYFYDVTEKYNLIQNIEDNKESVILVEVDNFEEVLKSIEEDSAPLLSAEIERNIKSYAQSMNSIIKKYSPHKYVIIVQDKYIKQEKNKKFDILDTIRDINFGNKLDVTLSMGVGRGGDTPQQNYEYAVSAKELALGRGGDQVVVKNGEKLSFYGGKTKEVEKRTKVRARVIAHALRDLISESSNIIIIGHINADADCIGASVGLFSTINSMNKECNILLDDKNESIKNLVHNLINEEEYENVFINDQACLDKINENTLLIIVDVHSQNHVQSMEIVEKCDRIVIIDHHRRSADYIQNTLLSYIEPYASSTSELVTEMIPYIVDKPNLKSIEAEALLTGICVDTKNFCFKTGVRTFEAAALLRRYGADTINVKKMFSEDIDIYSTKAEIIKSAHIYDNIAIAICPPDIEDNVLAAQVADELLNITGIQGAFVLVKIKGEIFISGRSLGEINVQVILEALGGGGHMTMAGAKVNDMEVEEVIIKLRETIDNYFKEGE